MNNREALHRHGTTPSSVSFLRNPLFPRTLLLSSAVALVALVVGVLLLDPSPDVESVMSDDAGTTDRAATSSGYSGDDAPAADGGSTLAGAAVNESPSDPHAQSILRGDNLIAEVHAQLAANPLPTNAADASSADFEAEVKTVREEIRKLRNELRNSEQ